MNTNTYPRLIIAGIRGGSGKTTVGLAVITALHSKKNLSVIPFKKGPDYIDAGWLSMFAHNPCYNLDPFLISKEKVIESFFSHFTGDIAVIEGNRGLYDGMDTEGSFSTAELSKLLKCPVILVVDCSKVTRTIAAIIKGCIDFDRDVLIKGVILNQIAGKRHELIIKQSIEKYCSIPILGVIPRLEYAFPERHMGLTPYHEHPNSEGADLLIQQIADKYLDIDKILDIAYNATLLDIDFPLLNKESKGEDFQNQLSVRIGVIKDSAFQFYYPENLEELTKRGVEIVEINAISDTQLPKIDALYIGGGFPETNAVHLAENESFKKSVKTAAENGLPMYAECGGLMFLGKEIKTSEKVFPMVGLLPISFEMQKKPQAHGYTIVKVDKENPFYPCGTYLQGHEFHYSSVMEIPETKDVYTTFKMLRGQGIMNKRDGLCYKNTLATYTHIHALGSPAWVDAMIKCATKYKLSRGKVINEL